MTASDRPSTWKLNAHRHVLYSAEGEGEPGGCVGHVKRSSCGVVVKARLISCLLSETVVLLRDITHNVTPENIKSKNNISFRYGMLLWLQSSWPDRCRQHH